MPVEQPVLDTNYKHLKIIQTWPEMTIIIILIYGEWANVSHRVMENFGYNESTSRYFVITGTSSGI